MPRLTEEDLLNILDAQEKGLPDFSPIGRLYGLVAEVLIHILGVNWVQDNVFGRRPLDQFLRSTSEADEDAHKKTDRIVEVAEMLFNFQAVSGIDGIVERIKNDSIEACVAELQAASLLYFNNTPFQFIKPSNQKGSDFDGLAMIQSSEVACEFKCKIESTKFSENSVKHVLDAARKQLPKNKPTLIFVKIPESWTRQRNTEEKVAKVIDGFLRQTTRVNSVILHWEEWEDLPEGKATRAIKYSETVGLNAKLPLGKIFGQIILNRDQVSWTHFNSVIEKKFGESDRFSVKPVEVLFLGQGYSWHSIIRLLPQTKPGEHVIFEVGMVGGTRITVLIGSSDCISLEVIDANLKKFSVQSTESFYRLGLDKFSYLRCQLRPKLNFSELSIWVDNKEVARKSALINQSSILFPNTTIGEDLDRKRNTALEVVAIAIFKASSDSLDQQMTTYYSRKFALNIPNL